MTLPMLVVVIVFVSLFIIATIVLCVLAILHPNQRDPLILHPRNLHRSKSV